MPAATPKALPKNVAALRTLVVELQGQLQERDQVLHARETELRAGEQELVYLRSWIDKLTLELARLRRMQFCRSSEQLDARIEQLELMGRRVASERGAGADGSGASDALAQAGAQAAAGASAARDDRACARCPLPGLRHCAATCWRMWR